ncbi:MAG: hypothetical protein HQL27_00135 [Candidatus Omnitrophica bacterium]|nr:hypothetical protein [Candidatus Omnitrophota bacterium]
MKTFFLKIFLVISAGLCMFEGLIILAVGLGRLSPERLVNFYNQLLFMPWALKTLQGVGSFFVILGFLLLFFASRTKPVPKMITVTQEGKILSVPQRTVKGFIKEIGDQNPYVSYFEVDFEDRPKEGMVVAIAIDLSGVPSVQRELTLIEDTLRYELGNVFGWTDFKFDFSVQGVSVSPNKRYFNNAKVAKKGALEEDISEVKDKAPVEKSAKVSAKPLVSEKEETTEIKDEAEIEPKRKLDLTAKFIDEDLPEDDFKEVTSEDEEEQLFDAKGTKNKKNKEKKSIISKILWGK